MFNWDQYANTVLTAYGVSGLMLVVLIGASLLRARKVKRQLDEIKDQ